MNMLTCLIFYAVIVVLCGYFVTKMNPENDTQKERKIYFVLKVVVIVLFILLVFMPTVISFCTTVQGAEEVAAYHDARIFYDDEADEYFAMTQNWWNPIKQTVRHELDQNYAIQLVEDYKKAKAVSAINIFTD